MAELADTISREAGIREARWLGHFLTANAVGNAGRPGAFSATRECGGEAGSHYRNEHLGDSCSYADSTNLGSVARRVIAKAAPVAQMIDSCGRISDKERS